MNPGWVAGAGVALTAWGLALCNPLVVLPGMLIATLSGLAWLWASHALAPMTSSLHLDRTVLRPGESVTGQLHIQNDQPFPVPWLGCTLEWPQEAALVRGRLAAHHRPGRAAWHQVVSLRWFERVSRRFEATCPRRGEYRFGPVVLRVSDPFGLYESTRELAVTQQLLVLPRTVPVLVRRGEARRPFGTVVRASWLWDDPAQLRGAREYRPGDPFSRLEWKATARTGRLHTREADATFDAELILVVNVATADKLWQGIDDELLERTILLAASLAHAATAAGRRLAVYTNGLIRGAPGPPTLRPGSGSAQLAAALRLMARLGPWPREPYSTTIARAAAGAGRQAQLLLVTGVCSEPILTAAEAATARRHQNATLASRQAATAGSLDHPVTLLLTGAACPARTPRLPALALTGQGGDPDQLAALTLGPLA